MDDDFPITREHLFRILESQANSHKAQGEAAELEGDRTVAQIHYALSMAFEDMHWRLY